MLAIGNVMCMYKQHYVVHVPNNPVSKFVHNIISQVKYQLFYPYYDNSGYYNVPIHSPYVHSEIHWIHYLPTLYLMDFSVVFCVDLS